MAKIIEKGTNYAYTIERIKEITFKKLRSVAIDFTKRLPLDLNDELYGSIQRGVCQLQSEPELNMYLHALGLMHEAKLQFAYDQLSKDFIDEPTIDIIDYGCGQAIGTMCYADFLRENGITQKVRKVTLIEPSEMALKRAALHTSIFFPNTEIVTINKGFDDLVADDIYIDDEISTLHIFSNVIDLCDDFFNLKNFAYLLNDRLDKWKGDNQFICLEPYFNNYDKDNKPSLFFQMLNIKPYYKGIFQKGTFVEEFNWTCQILMGMIPATEWYGTFMPDIDESCEESQLIDLASNAEKEYRYKEAFKYYMLAAKSYYFSMKSCRKIGELYYYGKGV